MHNRPEKQGYQAESDSRNRYASLAIIHIDQGRSDGAEGAACRIKHHIAADQTAARFGAASDGSAYREYVLTGKGRRLFLVTVALRQWGEDHL